MIFWSCTTTATPKESWASYWWIHEIPPPWDFCKKTVSFISDSHATSCLQSEKKFMSLPLLHQCCESLVADRDVFFSRYHWHTFRAWFFRWVTEFYVEPRLYTASPLSVTAMGYFSHNRLGHVWAGADSQDIRLLGKHVRPVVGQRVRSAPGEACHPSHYLKTWKHMRHVYAHAHSTENLITQNMMHVYQVERMAFTSSVMFPTHTCICLRKRHVNPCAECRRGLSMHSDKLTHVTCTQVV
jgi:hypothetical protein